MIKYSILPALSAAACFSSVFVLGAISVLIDKWKNAKTKCREKNHGRI